MTGNDIIERRRNGIFSSADRPEYQYRQSVAILPPPKLLHAAAGAASYRPSAYAMLAAMLRIACRRQCR